MLGQSTFICADYASVWCHINLVGLFFTISCLSWTELNAKCNGLQLSILTLEKVIQESLRPISPPGHQRRGT
jgi:hypothetical protein